MSVNIITQFMTKNGRANDLIALIARLLPESLGHDGCEEVNIRQNQDQPNDVISAQRWASRRHYEEYLAWRADNGVTAQFQEMLAEPISVRFFSDVPLQVASGKASRRQ